MCVRTIMYVCLCACVGEFMCIYVCVFMCFGFFCVDVYDYGCESVLVCVSLCLCV